MQHTIDKTYRGLQRLLFSAASHAHVPFVRLFVIIHLLYRQIS